MRTLVVAMVLVGCSGGGASDGGSAGSGATAGGGSSSTGGGTGGASAGGTGGTAGGTTGDGGVPFDAGSTPFAALCDQYFDALCTFYSRCGAMQDKATCLSVQDDRFNPWLRDACLFDERAQLDAGRVAYEDRAAAACLHALRVSAPCTQAIEQFAPECASLFRGLVPAGGACARSSECAPTHYCDSSVGMCPGRCVAKKPAGADAGLDEECQAGMYPYAGKCRLFALTGFSCAAIPPSNDPQRCIPNVAFCNGSACLPLQGDGGTCTSDSQCIFPLRCAASRCVRPAGTGEACGYGLFPGTPSVPCKFDLACSEGLGGGVCRALGVNGQGCFNQFECAGTRQCPGVFFGAGPDGGLQIDAGSCTPASGAGAPCTAAQNFCDVGPTYCNTDAGQCAARAAFGTMSTCTASEQCTPPDVCLGGVCRRPYCVLP
ncbi:MAG: hypothetical protein JNK82_24895 [Myxococcaceae bacterium]|nr:hypothetical protein [Myxococcaceae bacterium]